LAASVPLGLLAVSNCTTAAGIAFWIASVIEVEAATVFTEFCIWIPFKVNAVLKRPQRTCWSHRSNFFVFVAAIGCIKSNVDLFECIHNNYNSFVLIHF